GPQRIVFQLASTGFDYNFLVEHPAERGDHLRVELSPGPPIELLPRLATRERFTVRPLVRHGVVSVRHGDDAYFQGDRLAFKPSWVTASVPPLVVRRRHLAGEADETTLGAGEHVRADTRV